MSGIFISYRRDDSAYVAGRLRDDLVEHFGADLLVFRDVEELPLGDYPVALVEAVRRCDAMLVVIGDRWLTAADSGGNRRLDQPGDWVRREVALALDQAKVVVPVLVESARPPRPSELPPELARLPDQQAVELPDSRWDHELGRLAARLYPVLGLTPGVRVLAGPWSSPEAPVRLTVENVEVRPGAMRFHLAVANATADAIELAPDWFDVTDEDGHRYPPVPPWEHWPMEVAPGAAVRGSIAVGGGVGPEAGSLTAGWVRVLGTYQVGSVFATVEVRRLPGAP